MPNVKTLGFEEAASDIRAAGLAVGAVTTQVVFNDANVGVVQSQWPAADTWVVAGSAVDVVLGERADGGGGGGGCAVTC